MTAASLHTQQRAGLADQLQVPACGDLFAAVPPDSLLASR